ncbi:alpha/beta hydrolase family protein [Planomonospora corallina]|uniref:Alpha/beta hydrolase family protein n=1 Tax=Planomonospora corallina TaxID=1806052 RepID=A0ABV8I4T4_9ACTN
MAGKPAPRPDAAGALALPRPTGPHRVGVTALHLVDRSRPDPWVPERKVRELMVSIWYPARTPKGERAPYMTAEEAELLLKGQGVEVPGEVLSRTRTNAVAGATPRGRRGSLPLVVLSPGFGMPRSSLTALAEDLASRGYVVAGVDHTHEAPVTFPDGRTAPCAACAVEDDPRFGERSTRARAADVSFVLDRLTGKDPAWKHAGLIDPSRIGMAGHSIGGNSATHTMLTDPRVRAGVNMDGSFWIPIPDTGLARPFLLLGAGQEVKDPTWPRDWANLTGWRRWATVKGAGHGSFTDYAPLLAGLLGDEETFGTLSGARSLEITRTYVAAFFDLHLRGRAQPLLDRPSHRYPEVALRR